MSNSEFDKYVLRLEATKNKIVSSKARSIKFVSEVRSSVNLAMATPKKAKI